jgi:hypothetical protein
MRREALAVVIAIGAAGCGRCGAWGDIVITDEVGSDAFVAQVEVALADMERWTGRAEVCITDVVLREELEVKDEPVGGHYSGWSGRVLLAHPISTRHEVCHALDQGLSDDVAFPEAEGVSEVLYPTPAARKRERFAQICALGPPVPGYGLPFRGICDDSVITDAHRILLDEVYEGELPDPGGSGGDWSWFVDGDGVDVAFEPGEELWYAVQAPSGLLVATLIYADAVAEPEAGLVRIDLLDGSVTRVATERSPSGTGWMVFPTDGPIVFADGETAYVVEGGAEREIALPGYYTSGIVAGGRVWYDAGGTLAAVDLATGEPIETGFPYAGPIYRVASDGETLFFALFDGTIAQLDLASGAWTSRTGLPLRYSEFVALGGMVYATFQVEDESALLRVGADGTWSVPAEACVGGGPGNRLGALWTWRGDLWTADVGPPSEEGGQTWRFEPVKLTD